MKEIFILLVQIVSLYSYSLGNTYSIINNTGEQLSYEFAYGFPFCNEDEGVLQPNERKSISAGKCPLTFIRLVTKSGKKFEQMENFFRKVPLNLIYFANPTYIHEKIYDKKYNWGSSGPFNL